MQCTRHLTALSFALAACLAPGCHRPRGDAVDRWLIGEVMMHAEFKQNLRALSVPGGRLAGTENASAAEQYVLGKLREYGLENAHLEPFEMDCWTVHDTRVSVIDRGGFDASSFHASSFDASSFDAASSHAASYGDSPRGHASCDLPGPLALSRTMSTAPDGFTAPVVYVGDGSEAEFAAAADLLPGRLALARDGGPSRSRKVDLALTSGAVGLVVMMAPGREPVIGNGHRTPRPEAVVVIPHDPALLHRLARGDEVWLNLRISAENWRCRPHNVIAEIPGRGPQADEVVILGAHLDSWHLAEGGMDNGSGAAAILETVRAMARAAGLSDSSSTAQAAGRGERPARGQVGGRDDWRPRRTVRFIWFMAEELGLCGSEAYVARHAGELDRVVAMINADMPGSPRRIVLFGHPELTAFMQAAQAELAAYEVEVVPRAARGEFSDHAPFMRQGVATLSVFGELGPGVKHYHTRGDTFDTVDRRGTVQSSAVFAVLLRKLADAPERPAVRAGAVAAEEE